MEKRETSIQKLKKLLGLSDSEDDMPAEFAFDSAKEIIKDYCNIEEIPENLKSTALRMAVDIYRNEQPGDKDIPMAVKSISEGDTSTSFGTVETTGYKESVLKDYKKQLNRFRKVKF